ncbi:hypothetical protein [Fusobacterium sp. THCT1E2]
MKNLEKFGLEGYQPVIKKDTTKTQLISEGYQPVIKKDKPIESYPTLKIDPAIILKTSADEEKKK